MLYRLHVAYERIYVTFDSTLMCCCVLVCHVTHSSPFHRNSRAARAARQMTCTPAYKQQKHYVGAIATPLAMSSVVCFWTHSLVYRICKCFRNWPRPMIEFGLNDWLTCTADASPGDRMRKIDRLKVEIVHILVIITAVTQNHGNCRKSRHKARITVITAIVNSWFT